MKINVKDKGDYVIIQLSGTLVDNPDVLDYYDKLKEFIRKGYNNFIVDLHDVPWISSSGLGMLVCGLTSVRKAEGEMKLARLSGVAQKLFAVAQLDKIFGLYETVEDAVSSFKND